MVTDGLSWWQSWICVWLGYFIAANFVCLTGRIGAVYHIGFPVVNRASFGIWGSLWPVFNRAAMACICMAVVHWRQLRLPHDLGHLEELGECPESAMETNNTRRENVLTPLLGPHDYP